MRRVISVDYREQRFDQKGRPFTRTYLTTDDGSEAVYFGTDVEVGDEVEVFFHYGVTKARRSRTDETLTNGENKTAHQ